MTNKEIFEAIINQYGDYNYKLDEIMDFAPFRDNHHNTTFFRTNDGTIGLLSTNDLDAEFEPLHGSLEDFYEDNDINEEDMERFNDEYGLPYDKDYTSLDQINFEVWFAIKKFDEDKAKELVGKRIENPYDNTGFKIESVDLIEDNQIMVILTNYGNRIYQINDYPRTK